MIQSRNPFFLVCKKECIRESFFIIKKCLRFHEDLSDNHYKLLRRADARGRVQYYKDLHGMIEQLYNHPCIAVWVPFNEGWGQFDAKKATKRIRIWDKTRLVNEACGWFDQGGGDMYSIHNYSKKRNMKVKPQKNRVVALTEFGRRWNCDGTRCSFVSGTNTINDTCAVHDRNKGDKNEREHIIL